MKFENPLLKGRLIKRYKRFLSDIELESGEVITAHCANSGSMLTVKEPGSVVWVSPATNPNRKLKFTWELIQIGDGLVGINTSLPNRIVSETIEDGRVPELDGYETLRREVKYGKNSRIDILLSGPDRLDCYVEIKNVTLRRGEIAEFPDAVTARATKHLGELSEQVKKGDRAVMFYLVQRTDCDAFTTAKDIDPAYDQALASAIAAGVEVLVYTCNITPAEITVARPIPYQAAPDEAASKF